MSNKQEIIERIRAMTPEEAEAAKDRVLKAIFGPEEDEARKDVDDMTDEEVTAYLESEGFDIPQLHRNFEERMAQIKAKMAADPPTKSVEP